MTLNQTYRKAIQLILALNCLTLGLPAFAIQKNSYFEELDSFEVKIDPETVTELGQLLFEAATYMAENPNLHCGWFCKGQLNNFAKRYIHYLNQEDLTDDLNEENRLHAQVLMSATLMEAKRRASNDLTRRTQVIFDDPNVFEEFMQETSTSLNSRGSRFLKLAGIAVATFFLAPFVGAIIGFGSVLNIIVASVVVYAGVVVYSVHIYKRLTSSKNIELLPTEKEELEQIVNAHLP